MTSQHQKQRDEEVARRGFTLVEILVVLAILGILASLLLAAFSAMREKGRQTTCASNLKQIGIAINLYADDNSHIFPPILNVTPQNTAIFWPELLGSYIKNHQIYHCPTDAGHRELFLGPNSSSYNSSYGYNVKIGADLSLFSLNPQRPDLAPVSDSQIVRPSATVMMTDSNTMATVGLSTSQWPVVEPPSLFIDDGLTPSTPRPAPYARHQGRAEILWADGHVSALPLEAFYNTTGYKRKQDKMAGISPCFRPNMGCD